MPKSACVNTDIAIIGSGFSGLGMAIRLKQAGRHDFAVDERSGEVGGTWEVNTYPGCACDIPSHLYSFSFAPTPIGRRPTPSSRRSGRARGGTIEVRPEAQERFNAALDRRLPGSVWSTGWASWYLDETGPQRDAVAGLDVALPPPRRPPRPGRVRAQNGFVTIRKTATISSTPVRAPTMPSRRAPRWYSSDSTTSPPPAAASSRSTMAPSFRSAGMK